MRPAPLAQRLHQVPIYPTERFAVKPNVESPRVDARPRTKRRRVSEGSLGQFTAGFEVRARTGEDESSLRLFLKNLGNHADQRSLRAL